VLRVADASLGDYYTEKEFKKLSQEQRAEYCAELARQDSIYKAEMSGLQDEVEQSKTRSMRVRAEGDSLFALGTAIEKRIASEGGAPRDGKRTPPPDDKRPSPARDHVVRRGESLWAISASAAGYGRGVLWTRIYEANRGTIRDPNLIFPGQELSIPK
jgi:nucleoid-associated protein YgaU